MNIIKYGTVIDNNLIYRTPLRGYTRNDCVLQALLNANLVYRLPINAEVFINAFNKYKATNKGGMTPYNIPPFIGECMPDYTVRELQGQGTLTALIQSSYKIPYAILAWTRNHAITVHNGVCYNNSITMPKRAKIHGALAIIPKVV